MPVLSASELIALAQRHGADLDLAKIVAAAALAESGGNTETIGDAGQSRGLWQINDIHGLPAAQRHDPDFACQWMLDHEFHRAYERGQSLGFTVEELAVFTCMAAERPEGWTPDPPFGLASPAAQRYRTRYREIASSVVPDTGRPGAAEVEDVRNLFPFEGPDLDTRPLSQIQRVIYHHGASRTPEPTREAELALAQEYHRLHVSKGWTVLAYHFVVGPSGTAYYANNINLITYHALEANPTSVGICFLGNYEQDKPSAKMLAAAVRARRWVARQCGQNDLAYVGHKEMVDTDCPGTWWPNPGRALLADAPTDTAPGETKNRVAELESLLNAVSHDVLDPAIRDLVTARQQGGDAGWVLVAQVAERLRPYSDREQQPR